MIVPRIEDTLDKRDEDLATAVNVAIEAFESEQRASPDTAILIPRTMAVMTKVVIRSLLERGVSPYALENTGSRQVVYPLDDFGNIQRDRAEEVPQEVVREIEERTTSMKDPLLLCRRGWLRKYKSLSSYTLDPSCAQGVAM